jgi:hypothetical protein
VEVFQDFRNKVEGEISTGRNEVIMMMMMIIIIIIIIDGSTSPSGPRAHYRDFTIILRHTTVGMTPLDE